MFSILTALRRGALRLTILTVIGFILVYSTETYPMFFGEVGSPLLRGFGITMLALAMGDFVMRILQPHVDTAICAEEAVYKKNTAAAGIYLGRCLLAGIVLFLIATASRAGETEVMPPNAVKYSPLLVTERNSYWPDLKIVSVLGAQVEQETCPGLKSKECWSPTAQLKTSREFGAGLGQITKAFNANGSVRFDAMSDLVHKHPKELKGLTWSHWQDPQLQLRALVLMMHDSAQLYVKAKTQMDQMAFTFAAYNSGNGGVSNDILSCRAKPGCDPTKWFGNVAEASTRSKVVIPGYGQSPFQINQSYVSNILLVRRVRYLSLDSKTA